MWKKIVLRIGMAFTAALVFYAVVANCCTVDFFRFSIGELITIIIAVLFAFYATQYESDQRKMKASAERLLGKIQAFICSESFWDYSHYNSSAEYSNTLMMNNRSVNNQLTILEDYANSFKFVEDCKELKTSFKDYEEYIGEHYMDLVYLRKSGSELRRRADRMDEIIEKMYVKLYK